jgi:hypothetical protein
LGIGLLALTLVLALAFALFPWIGIPLVLDLAIAATLIGSAVSGILLIARKPALPWIAALLERQLGIPHQLLSLSLQLDEKETGASRELTAMTFAHARQALPSYPRRLAGLIRPRRHILCGALLLGCSGAVLIPQPSLLSYWDTPWRLMQQVEVAVSPGNRMIARGVSVTLRCTPAQPLFPSANLQIVDPGSLQKQTHLLRPDSSGGFSLQTTAYATFVYQFSLGKKICRADTITVIEPPNLFSLRIRLEPPAYTHRPPATLPEGQGSIAAYAGTRASFALASHFPLRRALFMPQGGDTASFSIVNGEARDSLTLWRAGSYRFSLQDTLGQINDSLPSFFIDILPDYPPAVRIVRPGRNIELTPSQRETLWVEGSDDLGIRRLELQWRRSTDEADSVSQRSLTIERGTTLSRQQVIWDLTEQKLYPGDTVFYWARIYDTKPFGSPQFSCSDTFWFRLPSFNEIHERIAEDQSSNAERLEQVHDRQQSTQDQLESLIKSAKGKEKLSWEEKKVLEDLKANMQSQSDSLQKTVESLQQTVEQMKQEGILNQAIAEKMQQVQEAIKDLIKQYGDSLLFKPVNPRDEISWRDVRQSLEKMKQMLPSLQEHLENTLAFLQMLKRDQALADLAAKAQKLAQQQMDLAQSPAQSPAEQMRHQQELLDNAKKMMDELRRLPEDQSPGDLQSAAAVDSLMKKMAALMSRKTMPSQSSMNQLSAGLQSLGQELSSMLSTAMFAQMLKDRDLLLALAKNALELSQWQSEQSAAVQDGGDDQAFDAANQQALKTALQKLLSQLDSLQTTPPNQIQRIQEQGDNAVRAMDNTLSAMGEGYPRTRSGGQASAGLNGLASALLASADAMKQGQGSGSSSGSGMMPGLQQLSGKQAAVNAMTGEMLRQMLNGQKPGGGGESRGSEEARAEAARAQKQIAEQLRQLAEKYGKDSDPALTRQVKELEEEARRLARMLESPSPQVADRQDRFLVRMLQTSLSMHREEQGKEERKSKSAKSVFSSTDLTDSKDANGATDSFYDMRHKALNGNYPPLYRLSVQSYFDSLGVLYLKSAPTGD